MTTLSRDLAGLLLPASRLCAANASMSADERALVIQLLRDSEAECLSHIENLSEAQWNWKPAPYRWSLGQTAEHILLAEITLFGAVQRAIQSPANPDWETKTAGKTKLLERMMPDRRGKVTAPERVQPQGLSRAEVVRRFKELRANTIPVCAGNTNSPERTHRGASLPHIENSQRIPVAALHPPA